MQTPVATVKSLYNAGYCGWGDITEPNSVGLLKGVNTKYVCVTASLADMCGYGQGSPIDLDYANREDVGIGFTDRIRTVINNGWTPIVVISIHDQYNLLPIWFYGSDNDYSSDAWTRYNTDGTKSGSQAGGNQLQAMGELCRQIAAGLAARGLTGLMWETIFESAPDLPQPAIHYNVASGIHQADPTAKIIGPATWPGSTYVENTFIKPYLQTYGATLLDYVSVHWYATMDKYSDIITMDKTDELAGLLSVTPNYMSWSISMKNLLKNPTYNPTGKNIGIIYSEYDATSISCYANNPVNYYWPAYTANTDCYINTNYFGGVWNASTLCYIAESNSVDVAALYQDLSVFGLVGIEHFTQEPFRTPLWYAWKLLQSKGSLGEGKKMYQTQITGPSGYRIDAFATAESKSPRVILINRSFGSHVVDVNITGLAANKNIVASRYIFNEDRCARFIGSQPNSGLEGEFEDAPNISPRDIALQQVDQTALTRGSNVYSIEVNCSPISITVLQIAQVGDFDLDGDVDFKDFAAFAQSWLCTGVCAGDFNSDNNVDYKDLLNITGNWLN